LSFPLILPLRPGLLAMLRIPSFAPRPVLPHLRALRRALFRGRSKRAERRTQLLGHRGVPWKTGATRTELLAANQLRAKGESLADAVIEAATMRLRPILMTTGAMVLGALPLALATGAGAESRMQIGWVIVGGMSFGTLLTLFVVPVAYSLLAKKAHIEAHGMEEAPAAAHGAH